MSDTATPEATEAPSPTPGDIAELAAKELKAEGAPEKAPRTAEQLEAELAKVRREAAGYRTKLREAEPLVKAAQEAEEANKTEVQKAQERAANLERKYLDLQQSNDRLDLAVQYSIPRDEIDLIGSGSREEMEARAARLGPLFAASEKNPAPPSNRPVEGLRPGASPEPPKPADNSYPANWGFMPKRES